MSLATLLGSKPPKTETIQGKVERFGYYGGNEYWFRYALLIEGSGTVFDVSVRHAEPNMWALGLVSRGDAISIVGTPRGKKGDIDDCTLTVEIMGRTIVVSNKVIVYRPDYAG